MKKWMYLIFPGAMLGLFLVFFLSHTKEAEAREQTRLEALAKKVAQEAAKKKEDETRARKDAEERAAKRAEEEAQKEREKLAKQYFQRGGESVTELAMMLGYADSSAFAKAFRRWTGMAPTEFLEQREAAKAEEVEAAA